MACYVTGVVHSIQFLVVPYSLSRYASLNAFRVARQSHCRSGLMQVVAIITHFGKTLPNYCEPCADHARVSSSDPLTRLFFLQIRAEDSNRTEMKHTT